MDILDVEEVRGRSKVDFDPLGYSEDSDLEIIIDGAASIIANLTGRTWEGMPADLEDIAGLTLVRLTEQIVYQAQEDLSETGADNAYIAAFSAGAYSETRRNPVDLLKLWNADPVLNGWLYSMATDDKKDELKELLTGQVRPEFAVSEVDWEFNQGRYNVLPSELGGSSSG